MLFVIPADCNVWGIDPLGRRTNSRAIHTIPISMTFHFFAGLSRQRLQEIYGGDSERPSAVLINSLSNYIYAAPADSL